MISKELETLDRIQQWAIWKRFKRGQNTADIASELFMRECDVARLLWAAREYMRSKTP